MYSLIRTLSFAAAAVIGTAAATHAASPWSPTFDTGGYDVPNSRGIAVGGCDGHACDGQGCHDDYIGSHHSPPAARNSFEYRRTTDRWDFGSQYGGRFDHSSQYLDSNRYRRNGTFDDGCFDRRTNAAFDDWRRDGRHENRWSDSRWDRPSTSTWLDGHNDRFNPSNRFEPWRPMNATNHDRLYR